MKTLAIYFLKRWWWVYLIVFVIDTLLVGTSEFLRYFTSFACLIVFSNYLQKGGNGVFWLPLTREQIGRVYWVVAVFLPTVIFIGSEILGLWLSNPEDVSLNWATLKHCLFFPGILSALIFFGAKLHLLFFFVVLGFHWSVYEKNNWMIDSGASLLSVFFIAIAFLRSEHFLEKQVAASKTDMESQQRFRCFQRPFKSSKQTGMNWILTTAFQRMIVNYLIFIAFVVFFRYITNSTFADLSFIIFVLFVPSILPLFLVFNLRVMRLLPFTTNKLAGLLVFLTFGAGVVVATLIAATAFFFKIHFDNLLATFLGILEGILIVQTTGFSVAGIGLRGAAAIYALVVIFIFAGSLLIYLPFVTGIRMEIPILISLPTAFLIQRYYLQNSSELYRPQMDNPSSL
jgi:hypothetical protein